MSTADPRSQADAAAAVWMARRQECDVSNEPRFIEWLAASDEHARAWADAERLWNSFDAEPDILLAAMRQVALQARSARRFSLAFFSSIAAVAAALILAIGVVLHGAGGLFAGQDTTVSPTRYETAMGQRATLTLEDASTLTLDSSTLINTVMTRNRRDVRLVKGQAYFAVAHDASRPFVVSVGDAKITALGTEFDILARPDSMRVILIRGSIAVVHDGISARLSPGEMIDTNKDGDGHPRKADMPSLLAWRGGFLVFREVPLADAVSQMNSHSRTQIVIEDRALLSLPVSGRFQAGDNARFARALAEFYSLLIIHRPDGDIVLRPIRKK